MSDDSKVIVYKISRDGQTVEVDGQGFSGGQCLEVAKRTMDKVGATDELKQKPEFFEKAHAHTQL